MLLYTINMGPVYKIRAITANALEDAVTKLTITSGGMGLQQITNNLSK
jgi:hypothetical protein